MTEILRLVTGPWKENCYLIFGRSREAIVIDPGDDFPAIAELIDRERLQVLAVLNTHAHYDHLGAVQDVKERYSVPFYLHSADNRLLKAANFYRQMFLGTHAIRIPEVDQDLAAATALTFGEIRVETLHTPGHTPGGVCFWINGEILITGDTVLARSIGRTDLPGGNRTQLLGSVDALFARFPAQTIIYPGHGEAASIGTVREENLDLRGNAS